MAGAGADPSCCRGAGGGGRVPATAINVIYFITLAGSASVGAFLPLYLFNVKQLPLKQVGLFGVLQPFTKFVAAPLWTSAADVFQAHATVYTAGALVACGVRMLYLPADGFGAIVCVLLLAELLGAGAGPMLDASVLATMADPDEWGKHRLWGAVGFGTAVLVVGYVLQWSGSFLPMFVMHAALTCGGVALVRQFLPLGTVSLEKRNDGAVDKSHALGAPAAPCGPASAPAERVSLTAARVMHILFGSSQRLAFFVVVLLSGMCTGVINNFLFLFLQHDLGASTGLVGSGRLPPPLSPSSDVLSLPVFALHRRYPRLVSFAVIRIALLSSCSSNLPFMSWCDTY